MKIEKGREGTFKPLDMEWPYSIMSDQHPKSYIGLYNQSNVFFIYVTKIQKYNKPYWVIVFLTYQNDDKLEDNLNYNKNVCIVSVVTTLPEG